MVGLMIRLVAFLMLIVAVGCGTDEQLLELTPTSSSFDSRTIRSDRFSSVCIGGVASHHTLYGAGEGVSLGLWVVPREFFQGAMLSLEQIDYSDNELNSITYWLFGQDEHFLYGIGLDAFHATPDNTLGGGLSMGCGLILGNNTMIENTLMTFILFTSATAGIGIDDKRMSIGADVKLQGIMTITF